MTRRTFASTAFAPALLQRPAARPNVILIMSDDQGYGDLSLHGNPVLSTPHMDSIGRDGMRFTQFHASPVCSPTRACLMTGRYNYRTGVVDTFIGRSMMAPDEVTVADHLRKAGYSTGIFGKWHLGDHYPMRAMDNGFDDCLVHYGGGIGQPSDPPGGESYFDPLLQRNGVAERFRGYCTDIFFNEASQFIQKNRRRPFFAYVPTNAPHAPLEVAESFVEPYRKKGLAERDARAYGMIANLDWNIGKLLAMLKSSNLERDTILIFMTDNGPQWPRYNAGLRGTKGTVYQGGIQVPFFVRWPARIKAGSTTDRLSAHVDVMPTLLELCGAAAPTGRKIDGKSLVPILNGQPNWPDRTMFLQWHRGDAPERWRGACARNQKWKLVEDKELFDLESDPGETTNLYAKEPAIAKALSNDYNAWFDDVCATRGFDPIRIPVGTPQENPVTLSQQDWRGPRAVWGPDALGHWELDVAAEGDYSLEFVLRPPAQRGSTLKVTIGKEERVIPLDAGLVEVRSGPVHLQRGPLRLTGEIQLAEKSRGVQFATVRKI